MEDTREKLLLNHESSDTGRTSLMKVAVWSIFAGVKGMKGDRDMTCQESRCEGGRDRGWGRSNGEH